VQHRQLLAGIGRAPGLVARAMIAVAVVVAELAAPCYSC